MSLDSVEQLLKIRHSAAHIMAAAVLKLFPGAKLGTGPATEDGFFYDIQTTRKITDKDLVRIEKEMQRIIKDDEAFVCKKLPIAKAVAQFSKAKQPYKVELINDLKKEGKKEVSIYKTDKSFVDLCRGPHVASSSAVGAFKLLNVAGAYWKGNESSPQMSRIYGTAFATAKELKEHLKLLELAHKRDHKKLGPALDLFTFSPLVGSGLPLWTPRGAVMRKILDDFVWELRSKRGYVRVAIPHITKKELYQKSGHWDKFKDELFKIKSREGHWFAVKPMNCPLHTQIYARRPHSYKEMPRRYANTTMVYRDEQSGELSGLTRVRAITQDDAHVFCRYQQVKNEFFRIWDIVDEFYGAFGFELQVELSLRDPQDPKKYLGTTAIWNKAENILRELAKERGVKAAEKLGEAAFYGPKIDFIAYDSLKRRQQVATIQLDMNLPERFDLTTINEKGQKERIVMIHAAIMGSIERFLAVIIEHFAGAFPTWLAPVQAVVLPISKNQDKAAIKTCRKMLKLGYRVDTDLENEPIGKRIRRAELTKVPYILVIGEKEIKNETIAVRKHGKGNLGQKTLADFLSILEDEVHQRRLS